MTTITAQDARPGDRAFIPQLGLFGNVLRFVTEYGENRVVVSLDNGGAMTIRVAACSFTRRPAHDVAPNRGRNVHCVCGAEYSLATNLRRHIERENGQIR